MYNRCHKEGRSLLIRGLTKIKKPKEISFSSSTFLRGKTTLCLVLTPFLRRSTAQSTLLFTPTFLPCIIAVVVHLINLAAEHRYPCCPHGGVCHVTICCPYKPPLHVASDILLFTTRTLPRPLYGNQCGFFDVHTEKPALLIHARRYLPPSKYFNASSLVGGLKTCPSIKRAA